jgi:L-seryl-tRNA(Ser) seleniumtransferase
MARALRIDKLAAAGLEASLRLALNEQWDQIPTYRALARSLEELQAMGDRLISEIGQGEIADGSCEPGGGSLPGVSLPSKRIGFADREPESLAGALRQGDMPVIGYIEKGVFWLDLRCLEDVDIPHLVAAVKRALA